MLNVWEGLFYFSSIEIINSKYQEKNTIKYIPLLGSNILVPKYIFVLYDYTTEGIVNYNEREDTKIYIYTQENMDCDFFV